MGDPGRHGQPQDPLPPGRPPFAPPPGTPYYGPPHDASWNPPPGTVFGGGHDVLATTGRRRLRSAWPSVARPVPAAGEAPTTDKGSRAVALLLAVAAIVAAVITARASLVSSDATGAWQGSVGDEQRRGALLLEGARYTYGSAGDMAFMIGTETVQAEELRAVASAGPSDVDAAVFAEAMVHEQVAELVRPASEIASDPRYALPEGGFDLQRYLADERAADEPDDDPMAAIAIGDEHAGHAVRLMLATVGVGIAFLFGALAQAVHHRRRPLLFLGWTALGVASVAAIAVELAVGGIAA